MGNLISNQESLVYVVDADSKQLIRKNFIYNYHPVSERDSAYDVIYGGVISIECGYNGRFTFDLDEKQITEFGYDYSSITGNVIEPSYDPELDANLCPSVVIISMSKLK